MKLESSKIKAKKDLALLGKSLNHWKRMARLKFKPDETPYSESCDLCKEYRTKGSNPCLGCPVFEFTRHALCRHTPVMPSIREYELNPKSKLSYSNFQYFAVLEIEFLKMLQASKKLYLSQLEKREKHP
jgi:hypothetical protein